MLIRLKNEEPFESESESKRESGLESVMPSYGFLIKQG